ncbi:MAG: hypothetical protein OHK0028_07790 [Deltaproteobacteria bacterium]
MGSDNEWRCKQCNKLLGKREGNRLHVRFARSHEYLVGPPVTATCWGCSTLNEYSPGKEVPKTVSRQ